MRVVSKPMRAAKFRPKEGKYHRFLQQKRAGKIESHIIYKESPILQSGELFCERYYHSVQYKENRHLITSDKPYIIVKNENMKGIKDFNAVFKDKSYKVSGKFYLKDMLLGSAKSKKLEYKTCIMLAASKNQLEKQENILRSLSRLYVNNIFIGRLLGAATHLKLDEKDQIKAALSKISKTIDAWYEISERLDITTRDNTDIETNSYRENFSKFLNEIESEVELLKSMGIAIEYTNEYNQPLAVIKRGTVEALKISGGLLVKLGKFIDAIESLEVDPVTGKFSYKKHFPEENGTPATHTEAP